MKTAVLLSGGVDSSVALRLLKEEGHDITAFYLKIWLQDEFSFLGDCPWDEDIEFCRKVCNDAGVPFEIVSMQTEYWEHVVAYTIDEIKAGRTPNPDMFCNRLIKFGKFIDKTDASFVKVASGHYAVVEPLHTGYVLKTSPDKVKDQTYFLAYLSQQQLSRALFPIGKYTKAEIRQLAAEYNLPNMNRKDSQGICFLGKIKFRDFIRHHLGDLEGNIVNLDSGKILGKHKGYYYYTIGQRSGLGLSGGPWYVVKKDPDANTIFVSGTEELLDKERNTFIVENINLLTEGYTPLGNNENLRVKIRHGAKSFPCTVELDTDNRWVVKIPEPEKGIAPGQFAVFYRDGICLGGSVISERFVENEVYTTPAEI